MGQALGGFNGGRCFCLGVQGFDRRHALGLAAFGPTRFLGFWGYIRFFGCGGWRFRPYGESPFPDAEKVTEKACSCVRPARWGSGFLRSGTDPWGSASGLLRCTSSRCVWLRQTVAALPPPDKSLHSACRRAFRSKAVLELTLIVLSGAASPHGVCTNKIVGASLLAMAA